MKVAIDWLKELVDLNVSIEELTNILPMRTIGLKEVTPEFIELDMKGYNRADLLSMRGVANEIAAITDSKVTFEEVVPEKYDLPKAGVAVEEPKLCPVYCIAKIENLKAQSSPVEWVRKLEASGMRTVNNIADVTNLVMLEFGQPMHSFDAAKVVNEALVVRKATKGESIQTLDGKDRTLDDSDLLISDSKGPLGIAGVMGGKSSEATDETTSILLEAAIFDPVSIRRTAQRHGLYSEAGKRFQHGLTKKNLIQAFSKAIKMYQEMGGKLTAISFTGDLEDKPKTLTLRPEKVSSLIGIDITVGAINEYLNKLGYKVEGADLLKVTIPYFRLDINIEEDLIEEVARMYGYDKIPGKQLEGHLPEKIDQRIQEIIYNLKKTLVETGLTEVQTYSFYSTDVLNNIGWSPDHLDSLIRVANPISSETEYMRCVLWQNLLEVVAKNARRYEFDDIAVFEIGTVYAPKKDGLPQEGYDLSVALMNGGDNPIEELYAIIQKVFNEAGIKLKLADQNRGTMEEMLFHPTRFQHLSVDGKQVGGIAEIHPRIVNRFGLEKRVAVVEISLEPLIKD